MLDQCQYAKIDRHRVDLHWTGCGPELDQDWFCVGNVQMIEFADRQTALSFVSLLDGYYRLQVDFHHHLCKDVESPMVSLLKTFHCHGPVR